MASCETVFFFPNAQGQIICLVHSVFFNFRYYGFSVISFTILLLQE